MGQRSSLTHFTNFFFLPSIFCLTPTLNEAKKQQPKKKQKKTETTTPFITEVLTCAAQVQIWQHHDAANYNNNNSSSNRQAWLPTVKSKQVPHRGFILPVINAQNTAVIADLANGNSPLIDGSHQRGTRSTISNYRECLPAISAPRFFCALRWVIAHLKHFRSG